MRNRRLASAAMGVLAAAGVWAGEEPPPGLLAASCGQQVVLAEPEGPWSAGFETGPVGWLYPAPGGQLFAPDLVNGRTTVFDLRLRQPVRRLDGVTMPHFGEENDRYVVVSEDVMVVTYPDRSLIARVDAEISSPWQAIVSQDGLKIYVLERSPDSSGQSQLVSVDLMRAEVLYRETLPGDVVRMALSFHLGLLALADREGQAHLVDPESRARVAALELPGALEDVAFAGRGELLVAALRSAEGRGELRTVSLKAGKKGLKRGKEHSIALSARPVRLAVSPNGSHAAVALAPDRVEVFELKHRTHVGTVSLPAPPRDLVWCDVSRPGPLLPEWSEGG